MRSQTASAENDDTKHLLTQKPSLLPPSTVSSPPSTFSPMNIPTLLGVAIGGAVGSLTRSAVTLMFRTTSGAFPTGTFVVNLVGSLLIGAAAAWAERGALWVRPWLMAGFLGGFTTFSAFSLENLRLLRDGHPGTALAYALVSVVAGVLLAFAGYSLARGIS